MRLMLLDLFFREATVSLTMVQVWSSPLLLPLLENLQLYLPSWLIFFAWPNISFFLFFLFFKHQWISWGLSGWLINLDPFNLVKALFFFSSDFERSWITICYQFRVRFISDTYELYMPFLSLPFHNGCYKLSLPWLLNLHPPPPPLLPHSWFNLLINQIWHIAVLQSSSVRGVHWDVEKLWTMWLCILPPTHILNLPNQNHTGYY